MQPRVYAFISTDHQGKPKSSDRWLIRSYCMHDKNKKVGLRYRDETRHQTLQPVERRCRRKLGSASIESATKRDVCMAVPKPFHSDFSLIGFSYDVCTKSRQLLYKFLTTAEDTWFPADLGIDIDVDKGLCFPWLSEDQAYLHTTLFAASGVYDWFTHNGLSNLTYHHLGKAIGFIHQHMTDNAGQLGDSTISAVITLILLSSNFVDYSSAKVHAEGLRQIVRLRGGLGAFQSNPKLIIKLSRVDFAYYLHTGNTPQFSADPRTLSLFSGGLQLNEQCGTLHSSCLPEVIRGLSDQSVACVFQDLQIFSSELNRLKGNRNKLSQTEFRDKICLLQCRLLQLQGKMTTILAECLRLAMLAYLTTTFQIPFNAIRYPYLAAQFRTCYNAIGPLDDKLRDLVLWFLVIGAISLYGLQDPWLRERWQSDVPPLINWDEARAKLSKFPWIEAIHGRLADSAFHVLQNGVDLGPEDDEGLCASGWAICPLSA